MTPFFKFTAATATKKIETFVITSRLPRSTFAPPCPCPCTRTLSRWPRRSGSGCRWCGARWGQRRRPTTRRRGTLSMPATKVTVGLESPTFSFLSFALYFRCQWAQRKLYPTVGLLLLAHRCSSRGSVVITSPPRHPRYNRPSLPSSFWPKIIWKGETFKTNFHVLKMMLKFLQQKTFFLAAAFNVFSMVYVVDDFTSSGHLFSVLFLLSVNKLFLCFDPSSNKT